MKLYPTILILLIALAVGCKGPSPKQKEFQEFTDKFPEAANSTGAPLLFLSDTMKDFWAQTRADTGSADSFYIKKYALLKKYTDTKFPPEKTSEIDFKKAAKFNRNGFTVLLYSGATTGAGSGNYMMIIASFTKEGEKVDEMPLIKEQEWDFDRHPFQLFSLPNDSNFTITDVTRNYGFLGKELVPTYSAQTKTAWRITEDGHFVKGESVTQELFSDTNPAIVDSQPRGAKE